MSISFAYVTSCISCISYHKLKKTWYLSFGIWPISLKVMVSSCILFVAKYRICVIWQLSYFKKSFKCFFFSSYSTYLQKYLFNLKIRAWLPSLVCFFRLENVQYPYQLYIAPSTSSTERPSPNGPDRPFQCPTCGVRFTRIQNLKQHMLIHSGNVIFPVTQVSTLKHFLLDPS